MNFLDLNLDKIYYEDDNILLCDLVHGQLNYTKLNKNRYHLYFKESIFGFKYFTLINKKHKYIIHADTEIVSKVTQPLLLDLTHFLYQIKNPKILFLGLGNANIARNISLPHLDGNEFTFYEDHHFFKPIESIILPPRSNVIYVDVYDYKTVLSIDKQKYDVIINDIDFNAYSVNFYCDNFLNDVGRMYMLADWKQFDSTPYNYIKLTKENNNLSLEDISNIGYDLISYHVNEISNMKWNHLNG